MTNNNDNVLVSNVGSITKNITTIMKMITTVILKYIKKGVDNSSYNDYT